MMHNTTSRIDRRLRMPIAAAQSHHQPQYLQPSIQLWSVYSEAIPVKTRTLHVDGTAPNHQPRSFSAIQQTGYRVLN